MEQIDVRGDGRIVLYKRPGLKNPKWQARIRVPNAKEYKVVTTKTNNLRDATRFAENLYEELYMHVKAGGTVKTKTFQQVYDEWIANTNPSPKRISGVRYYALPYFSKMGIDKIDGAEVARFWEHRQKHPLRDTGSDVPLSTMIREVPSIKPVFAYAKAKGYIKDIPPLRPSSAQRVRLGDRRRPTFTRDEWRRMTNAMHSWMHAARSSPPVYRDRYIAQHYFLVLANTGIRVGEARTLKWTDVRKTADGYTILEVTGKTGSREVAAAKEVHVWLDAIKRFTGDQTLVFCHSNGSPIGSCKRAFESMLAHAKVARNDRTIYSLRHYYAVQRITHGVDIYLLAKNLGTSVLMIERHYGQIVTSQLAQEITKTQFMEGTGADLTAFLE